MHTHKYANYTEQACQESMLKNFTLL